MKKIIPVLFVFFLFYFYTNKEQILIPDYAIRFRVIANSNSKEDQDLKIKVKDEVEERLNKLMIKAKSSEEAKQLLQNELDTIKTLVNTYTKDSEVSFGQNYFPEKEYHGVIYQSGNYDSLVITLGHGLGNNWWCVMYPPLCMLENKNNEEVEYRFLIQDILNKYQS